MNFNLPLSNEVIVGIVTFLLPILFSIVKRGVTPYFTRRAELKSKAKYNAEISRQETVDSLVSACEKSTLEQMRVLVPKLISKGERPRLSCFLDYIEREDSHRLKKAKKFLLNECKKDKNVKEIVAIAVSDRPDLATELADVMTRLI